MLRHPPTRKASWWRRAVGEISKLVVQATSFSIRTARWNAPYALNSTRVDYELAKQLYKNTHDSYKLGAAFARPVIDTTVGFMGVPRLQSEDEEAQAVLDDYFGAWTGRLQKIERNALRDGDCFVRLARLDIEDDVLYPEAEGPRLDLTIVPAGQVEVELDPATGQPAAYIISTRHQWGERKERTYVRVERVAKDGITVTVEGDAPPGVVNETQPNPWGFIPIAHFKNEAEEDEVYGSSDLEPIEPFMKAYHDVMLYALQGSKMHSAPRLKLKLKDIARFLANNFGLTEADLAAGKTISLQGHELLLFQDDEDAEFIEVKSATGGAEVLLKFLFMCIVDVSETPEFAFGTAVQSSKASVSEQMPALVRKVGRKREQFTEQFKLLARMVLAMTAQAESARFSTHATEILWDEINPKDEAKVAETLERIVNALNVAVTGSLISHEAAVQYLATFVDTMNDYLTDDPELPGERERIIKSKLLLDRLNDGTEGAPEEKDEIDQILKRFKPQKPINTAGGDTGDQGAGGAAPEA